MAYRTLDDDEAQRLTGTGTVGATAVTGSAPVTAGAPGAASPAAPASRFVGFSQYLAANRGAADATAGRIADSVDAAQQRAQDAAGAVRAEVDASTPAGMAPPALSGTAQRLRSIDAPPQQPRQGQGPQQGADASSYDAYATAAREAQQATANTGTTGGLQQLIGTGAAGAGRFDAGLVGAAGGQRFAAQRSRYADLAGALDPATYTRSAPTPGAASAPAAPRSAPQRREHDDELMGLRRRAPNIRRGGI